MAADKNAGPLSGKHPVDRALLYAACALATLHMLVEEFRYVITPWNWWGLDMWAVERWAGLALAVSALLWILYGLVLGAGTADRLKTFFKGLKIYEYVYVAALFAWILVVCIVRQDMDKYRYIAAYDWWLFDAAVYSFLLFPAARLLGKNARRGINLMLDVVTLSYTAFAAWAMAGIMGGLAAFRADPTVPYVPVALPSGSTAVMDKHFELYFGCHYNITGAISLTLFAVSCWMASSRGKAMRWVYAAAAAVNLYVAFLSNSRTVYVCLLAMGAAVAFFALWHRIPQRKTAVRALCCVGAAAVGAGLVWGLRKLSFLSFDAVTGFSGMVGGAGDEALDSVRELNGLSGRERVWSSALKVMGSGVNAFIFGVSPFNVTDSLVKIGGLHFEAAHAHNEILQVGTALGVPAMIAFVVFLVRISYRSFRILFAEGKPEYRALAMAAVAFGCLVILDLAEAYLNVYYSIMSSVFFLLCGVITEGTRKEPAPPEPKAKAPAGKGAGNSAGKGSSRK